MSKPKKKKNSLDALESLRKKRMRETMHYSRRIFSNIQEQTKFD